MSRAAAKSSRKKSATVARPASERPWKRLTQAAFVLSLIVVAARMTMQEVLRSIALPVPGAPAAPAIPGPATSIGLDLLCCVPAMLVLSRRLVDATFRLRLSWSHLAMLLLGAWTLLSVLWSSDQFAALVNAMHWAAALAMIWSTSQLVRSWLRFRVVAAVSVGLLGVLLLQGYYYRWVDLPDLQQNWKEHRAELLQQQGAFTDTTQSEQIAKNIENGVPTGFNISRNTYAAVLVLLMTIAAGVAIQRKLDGDGWSWAAPILCIVAAGLFMLYRYVQSKTAFATPVVAAGVLLLLARRVKGANLLPPFPGRERKTVRRFWIGVAVFAFAVAAVIGHGLKHGTLVHISLTFRWWYWVGAARLFVHHPWLGVGWANFGPHYLAYRLPQAAEEPSDPHNFLVRAFVELGVVGGILMIAWMLRLWWELTVFPVRIENQNAKVEPAKVYSAAPFVLTVCLGSMLFAAAVSIDWSASSAWIILECFKRLLFVIVFVAGVCVALIRSFDRPQLDDRPAPYLLSAVVLGLGLFLLHNLIDFSIFEVGPMFLFALVTGAALGVRLPAGETSRSNRWVPIAAFVVAGVLWIVAAGAVWSPIFEAESLAAEADDLILASRPAPPADAPLDGTKLERAQGDYLRAFRLVPYDADYAFKAEQASLMVRSSPVMSRQLIDAAIAADPYALRYRVARAVLEASTGEISRAEDDYSKILSLDPNNLDLRLQFAELLEKNGQVAQAHEQYRKLLESNEKLAPDEIRRLPETQVRQIRKRIGESGA